jgi:hypothetical protein
MIRRKIISRVDKTFIHHALYTAELPRRNFTGSKYQKLFFTSIKGKPQYAVDFLTNSATDPGTVHYHQLIALLKLGELLRDKKPMLMRDRLLKAVSEGDLLVTCDCPAYCLHEDTKIKLLNQKVFAVKDLKEKFDKGEKLYVYSTDAQGNFKPGLVNNVWISGEIKEMIKVTLDNGRELLTTAAHQYMMRDGSYKEAHLLKEYDSLMPLYFKDVKGYEKVQLNNADCNNPWKTVYGIVARECLKDAHIKLHQELVASGKEKFLIVHHEDFDKKNNYPENLRWMGKLQHFKYHANLCGANRANVIAAGKQWFKDHAEQAHALVAVKEFLKEDSFIGKQQLNNHKVLKVEKVMFDIPQKVYDISVENYNNFYTDAGVVLHNCYWGYKYLDTKMKIAFPGREEKRYPKVRNPRLRGIICKHLELALSVLPFNVPLMLKDLKRKELQ